MWAKYMNRFFAKITAILLCSLNINAYIEKIVFMENIERGTKCFIGFDNHWSHTKEENNIQASVFLNKVLPVLSNKKTGIFFESIFFYKFLYDKSSLNSLDLDDSILYKSIDCKQPSWIYFQLPYLYLKKYGSQEKYRYNLEFKSIDPRFAIDSFRRLLAKNKKTFEKPISKNLSLYDLHDIFLSNITKIFDVLNQKSELKAENYTEQRYSDLFSIFNKLFKILYTQINKLDSLLKRSFLKENSLCKGKKQKDLLLMNEFLIDQYKNFLNKPTIKEGTLPKDLAGFVYDDSFMSGIIELISLLEIEISGEYDLSIVLVGNFHARNLVGYLELLGYKKIKEFTDIEEIIKEERVIERIVI